MPFTFSHPALILPFTYLPKRWVSFTGLIIGSLTPDFEYFLKMKIQGSFSHTLMGLFLYDLPFGVFLAFVFHRTVKNDLFQNLPMFFKARLSKFNRFQWVDYFKLNWIIVIFSILIGAFSHLLWDSFTHYDGYFVNLISTLKNKVELFGFQFSIFNLLQHLSSLIGAIFIFLAFWKLPIEKMEEKQINLNYWISFFIIAVIVILIRFFCGLKIYHYGDVIVTIISATLIGLIFAPRMFIKWIDFNEKK